MDPTTTTADPAAYLAPCEIIDFHDPDVAKLAASLARGTPWETAKSCFTFVRDEVFHSADYKMNPVTCRASEVLRRRTGFCYAKSHLLAALLRANSIPTGLSYQRLTISGDSGPYCLHGLNSLFLGDVGWYRVDARGNRDDVDAQFCPPEERLAFRATHSGEQDLPGIYVSPLPGVVDCLTRCVDWAEVCSSLPDV